MKILLTCTECEFKEWGSSEKELINKVIIWNHVKKAHPTRADRIMKLYQTLPSHLYDMKPAF